ncbi:MAG: hypothetical protein ACYSTS_14040 [Planctomycetota bacterium]
MKTELIKWNAGTIIDVTGVVAAIVKLIGLDIFSNDVKFSRTMPRSHVYKAIKY